MMLLNYPSKKVLKENVGQTLKYQETSMFGPEYLNDGTFCGAHRPAIQGGGGREFFAEITMKGGLISKVS